MGMTDGKQAQRAPLAHGIAAQVAAFLEGRPEGATIAQIATALGQPMSIVKSRLDMHAETTAPRVRRAGLRWYYVQPEATLSASKSGSIRLARTPTWRKSGSGKIAGPREHVASGVYVQPRPFVRPGADDYRAVPSRFGTDLIPYGQ
jgi:hypothetical protein